MFDWKKQIANALYYSGALTCWREGACLADRMLKKFPFFSMGKRGSPIFMFHRIVEQRAPESQEYITTIEEFELFCQLVSKYYQVVSLPEIVARRTSSKANDRLLAITFDDGFADNYHLAWPILRKHGLCATLFITTACVGETGRPMWTARLDEILKVGRCDDSAKTILGVPLLCSSDQQILHTRSSLSGRMKLLPMVEREAKLLELQDIFQVHDFSRLQNLMLSWSQIKEMHNNGFFIGGHTINHVILSRETEEVARQEICGGKEEIEGHLGEKIDCFAYPNGKQPDFSPTVISLVQKAGFKLACSTLLGTITSQTNPYELPRFTNYHSDVARMAVNLEQSFYHQLKF